MCSTITSKLRCRMPPSYFEYMSSKGGKPDIALDVIEFDMPPTPGIEVEEKTFENTGKLLAYVARETAIAP
jgi:hypothetical protein